MINMNRLKESILWFNDLESNKQMNILDFLVDKSEELILSEDEKKLFKQLISNVVELIVSEDNNEELVKKVLLELNADKIVVNAIYGFCEKLSVPFLDAKIISIMAKDNVIKTSDFVINHMILFSDYDEEPIDNFLRLTGLKDINSAFSVVRFIKNHYSFVSMRKLSPIVLERKLLNEYKIPAELVEEIVKPIFKNRADMHQAYLMEKVTELLNIMDNITTTETT